MIQNALPDDDDFQALSPHQLRFERLLGMCVATFGVVIVVCILVAWYLIAGVVDLPLVIASLIAVVIVFLCVWFGWIFPGLSYRRSTWRLNSSGLEIRRGVWWQHRIAVPRSRIQHSDIEQGPLQRRYDLSTLIIHTAGTKNASVKLEGISHHTAESLRANLVSDA